MISSTPHLSQKAKLGRIWIQFTLIAVLLAACGRPENLSVNPEASLPGMDPRPASAAASVKETLLVAVRALSGKTIPFQSQNGQVLDGIPTQRGDLPYLVLLRNGMLTSPEERTLHVNIAQIQPFASGTLITISAETLHQDPDQVGVSRSRIAVWSQSITIANPSKDSQASLVVDFEHEFTAALTGEAAPIPTPTDYYRLEVSVRDAGRPDDPASVIFSQEYAFLLEQVWDVPLPQTLEASSGSAPTRLVLYACDMFMPEVNRKAGEEQLSRQQFPSFLEKEILPAILAAYRLQTDAWQVPWYGEWKGFRQEEDPKSISVAFTGEDAWYHGPAPRLGNAAISINLAGLDFSRKSDLPNEVSWIFHHEMFHSLERNIELHAGGNGEVNGKGNSWGIFSEGMAVAVQSIALPQAADYYTQKANEYIQENLNSRYREMSTYNLALYWRFLFEQCGGMQMEGIDLRAGMQVFRRSLEVLYSKEIVDIAASEELISSLPPVMDRALAGSLCPFQNYAGSLAAFARAIYSLKLEAGRCIAPGLPAGCGLYDLDGRYASPRTTVLRYSGIEFSYSNKGTPGVQGEGSDRDIQIQPSLPLTASDDTLPPPSIMSSFGMDFVEVAFDSSTEGLPLVLEFSIPQGSPARFIVQVVTLKDAGQDALPHFASERTGQVDSFLVDATTDHTYQIPALNTAVYDRLALIIVRLDPWEKADSVGEYSLILHP